MAYPSFLIRRLAFALALMAWAASSSCLGADARDSDVAELKRAIAELQAQNRSLADRLRTLEAERQTKDMQEERAPSLQHAQTVVLAEDPQDLARRVKELELSKISQAEATRTIILDSLSKQGAKINQSVALGGSVEMRLSKMQDFSGASASALRLNAAELDLEIQANPWSVATLVLGYADGGDVQFPNSQGFSSGVDRISVDTASITIGDVQRFPLFMKAGRMNLGFGSSTGVHRADVLSIENPLTTEAFETRREAIGLGFAWPTPTPSAPAPPVLAPPVRPQVIAPLVGAMAHELGYKPLPQRPVPPSFASVPPELPPFYGEVYFYESHNLGIPRDFSHNVNARLGYRTRGHCGKRYSELRGSDLCPWTLDFNVDYLTSVFDSRFLSTQYRPFLNQFATVHGLASTLKMSFGPVQLTGEWTGATERAVFTDDAGTLISILPSAWQIAAGYQFDWNPWVESIGAQGTYVALGYSQSRDLAGARQQLNGALTPVGALPYSRWTLTAGEWVQDGLKLQLEYSRTSDYSIQHGGTGNTAEGLQMTLTYGW